MDNFAHPEVLVLPGWVAQHAHDPNVVVAEVDVGTSRYMAGHIAGAVCWDWKTQLCDQVRRDIVAKTDLEHLLGASGADAHTTIILYGDHNNWFAAWAFWLLKIYGHRDVRLMDGGRKNWVNGGWGLTTRLPTVEPKTYRAQELDFSLRAFLPEVRALVAQNAVELVDVRTPQEFSGKVLAPPGLVETCQRGGHLPGAKNIPWSKAVNVEKGTFKPRGELRAIYRQAGITGEKPIITYCRIGERSSHSWFVLKYLLGFDEVKNYDGSWTEWGNLVGVEVERGTPSAIHVWVSLDKLTQ